MHGVGGGLQVLFNNSNGNEDNGMKSCCNSYMKLFYNL